MFLANNTAQTRNLSELFIRKINSLTRQIVLHTFMKISVCYVFLSEKETIKNQKKYICFSKESFDQQSSSHLPNFQTFKLLRHFP